jgi:hypothetical protein
VDDELRTALALLPPIQCEALHTQAEFKLELRSRLSHPPYKMRLDTVGNIARELGRLYRAGLSGPVNTAEAARLAFILKELRGALESERESRGHQYAGWQLWRSHRVVGSTRQDLGARPATSTAARSFDHLVSSDEQFVGHGQPERLRRLEVDDQLEFGRRLHRQIAWLRTLENTIYIQRGVPIQFHCLDAIGG